MNYRALVAEFIGTFALIFVGVMSIAAFTEVGLSKGNASATLVGVALAHGLTIACLASATAGVSGGHLNPAVTLGLFVGKKIEAIPAAAYILFQLLGAWAGAALANWTLSTSSLVPAKLGAAGLNESVTLGQGVVLEAVATFFLVFVVYGTAVDKRAPKVGALFIGLTVTLGILFCGPFTGAAINPARWFGPAMVMRNFENAAVWTAGPLLGGLLAGLIYAYVLEKPDSEATTD